MMAFLCHYDGAKVHTDRRIFPPYDPCVKHYRLLMYYGISKIHNYLLMFDITGRVFPHRTINFNNQPTEKLRLGLLVYKCSTRETADYAQFELIGISKVVHWVLPLQRCDIPICYNWQVHLFGENVAGNDGKTDIFPKLLQARLKGKGHDSLFSINLLKVNCA